jgi:hypothetical protein
METIEAFDVDSRLARGRSYARSGQVLTLANHPHIWEKLGDPKPQFNLEIHLPNGDKLYKVLGPHAPNLTANEVNLLHRLWLRFSDLVQPEELHHHDVVHFALEEVQTELDAGKEEELLSRLHVHLAANRNKKKTPLN